VSAEPAAGGSGAAPEPDAPAAGGAPAPAPYRLGYHPAFDGLRAVAILMVIAFHDRRLVGGFLGVDLFFALSGFLITAILLEEWDATRSIHLPRFYARRFLRLAPALYTFVLVVYAGTHWFRPELASWLEGRWAVATLLYVPNLLIAFGREYPIGAVSICWSLGIEEQFYLVWPLAFRTLLRRGLSERAIAALLLVPIVAAAALRLALVSSPGPNVWLRVYFAPDTRADALLVGCVVALALARAVRAHAAAKAVGALAGAAVLALLATSHHIMAFVSSPMLFSASATASALMVAGLLGPRWLRRPLEWAPLVYIGRLSYSLYLWHEMGIMFGAPGGTLGKAALLLALAAASHHLVERPFLKLKRRLNPTAS
jgi:peptidoglycan/LPS O-acetylase OafA/YrhL